MGNVIKHNFGQNWKKKCAKRKQVQHPVCVPNNPKSESRFWSAQISSVPLPSHFLAQEQGANDFLYKVSDI
jgi:hypothetical protein